MTIAKIFPQDSDAVRIIPLGGCGEFGMNLTAYLHRERLFVVDCGVMFPDPMKLGVEAVIPGVHDLFEQAGGPLAYFLTHGHEDHIGAMPYVIERWPAPIYCTAWTAELLRGKFNRRGYGDRFPITVVEPGDHIRAEGFDVEYVHVNHSIPMSCALVIRTPKLKVFHTGDFRIDPTPVIEPKVDLEYLSELGKEGIDLMLSDSTNATREGFGPSEKAVIKPLSKIFDDTKGAVVITTFSSNFWRIKSIIDICVEKGRKLLVLGRGVDNAISAAGETGIWTMPRGLRVEEENASQVPRGKLCVIATGSQGEFRSAMIRIALGEHKGFKIKDGDTVVFSSRIIPGNERIVQTMMSWIDKAGGKVVTTREDPGIHVSGHAWRGEILELMKRLKPKMFLPIHGTFTHMHANQTLLAEAGLSKSKTLLIENGDVVDAVRGKLDRAGQIEVPLEFIDGESYLPIAYETLRQRLRIGENGGAFVSGVFNRKRKDWDVDPVLLLQGIELPWGTDTDEWHADAVQRIMTGVEKFLKLGKIDSDAINEEVRVTLRRHFSAVLGKKPVVITQIHLSS